MNEMHGTTIVGVKKNGQVAISGDGQVSLGNTVIKHSAKKVRYINSNVIAGFAGSTADAFTLFERLEKQLENYPDQLLRACVELAKQWRSDKYLRKLEAMMLVADKNQILVLTGNGDVLEPDYENHDKQAIAIGSGGNYALAAAEALLYVDNKMSAKDISIKAINIASNICVFTNNNITTLELK